MPPGGYALMTKEKYAHWINTFIQEGRNFARVGRAMDVSKVTASKAWHEGWPKQGYGPISVIYDEQVNGKKPENPASAERENTSGTVFAVTETEARTIPTTIDDVLDDVPDAPPINAELVRVMGDTEINRLLETAVMRVRANVAQALLAEQEMIGTARNNLQGILVLSDKLLAGLMPVVDTVVERLHTMASDASVDPKRVLGMIDRVIKINASTVTAGAKLLEMQRLMVGMPQSIHEQRQTAPVAPQDAPTDAAREELIRSLERTKRKVLAERDPYVPGESKLPEVDEPMPDASNDE